MLKNYFTIALRNLGRNKGYAAINVAGLAVGMAACLLIGLYVQDERSYDRFHERADRIYRVTWTTGFGGTAAVPASTLSKFKEDFAEVEAATHLAGGRLVIRQGSEWVQEEGFLYADPSVFDVFSFPLLRGNPDAALREPGTVVLTETAARRYFGDGDPLGQTLALNDGSTLRVTGVMADVPANSHLQFDALVSLVTLTGAKGLSKHDRALGFMGWQYLLLTAPEAAATVDAHLDEIVSRGREAFSAYFGWWLEDSSFDLQALTHIHLHSDLSGEASANGDAQTLYLFALIALFILMLACINYMNLATARSMQRAREVGVRKAAGARRRQLAGQFLSEAALVTSVAAVGAMLLAQAALPLFSRIAGRTLAFEAVAGGWLLPGLAGLLVLVGLLAGSYPAFVLSRFRAVEVLRGAFARSGRGARLRKGLVVFQFALSAALVAGTLVVVQQLRYMRGQDLGFDKERVLVIDASGVPGGEVVRQAETLKRELARHPAVERSTATSSVPGRRTWKQMTAREGLAEGDRRQLDVLTSDLDFISTFGIELVAGRDFAERFATDLGQATILNRAAVERLGWTSPEEALGKRVLVGGLSGDGEGTVVGVMADVHYRSLHERVEPMAVLARPRSYDYVALRIGAGDVPEVIAHVEATWKRLFPGYAFDAFFLDGDFERQYRAEERLADVLALFGGLAVLVACLGLFGLAAFSAEQRTKEIGIRKALGASAASIAALLSKDFARLVLVAVLLAAPVAFFAMRHWLEGFAYHIVLGPDVFLLAGGLALAVALLTVSYHAIKAATADPVESLRYE